MEWKEILLIRTAENVQLQIFLFYASKLKKIISISNVFF